MPGKCGETWLENNPEFLDVDRVTTDTPFPEMTNDYAPNTTVENWLGQPVLPWVYESGPEKAVAGLVTTEFYFDGTTCYQTLPGTTITGATVGVKRDVNF